MKLKGISHIIHSTGATITECGYSFEQLNQESIQEAQFAQALKPNGVMMGQDLLHSGACIHWFDRNGNTQQQAVVRGVLGSTYVLQDTRSHQLFNYPIDMIHQEFWLFKDAWMPVCRWLQLVHETGER